MAKYVSDLRDTPGREARELKAEAIASVIERYVRLVMDGSALYFAGWDDDDAAQRCGRLERTQEPNASVIDVADATLSM